MDSRNLHVLVEAFVDNSLSDDAAGELLTTVSGSPELLADVQGQVAVAALLRTANESADEDRFIAAVMNGIQDATEADAMTDAVVSEVRRVRVTRRHGYRNWDLRMAASFIVMGIGILAAGAFFLNVLQTLNRHAEVAAVGENRRIAMKEGIKRSSTQLPAEPKVAEITEVEAAYEAASKKEPLTLDMPQFDESEVFEEFTENQYSASVAVGHRGGWPSSLVQAESADGDYLGMSESGGHRQVQDRPLSTFAVDVDTASYTLCRRYLERGQVPPPLSVRIEEFINYFRYNYSPQGIAPISIHTEVASCPWDSDRMLALVGLNAREVPAGDRGPANLVFLLDVSGSMKAPDKLPLLKQAMGLLLDELRADDRIAIVTYADGAAVVLPSTPARRSERIRTALDNLRADGQTNGSAGIHMAYSVARQHFIRGGVNRVILATDGDFNLGVTNHEQLTRLIADKRRTNVFLSVLGFGDDDLRDETMELLANRGNGHYAYIDSLGEAQRVLVQQLEPSLVTVAKDVKVQVEFNPRYVGSYRLIGYGNRRLAGRAFRDDRKDGGEMGAGQQVTVLYELEPSGMTASSRGLKYQSAGLGNNELLTVNVRYKQPEGNEAAELSQPLVRLFEQPGNGSSDLQWAAAVAAYAGLLKRESIHQRQGFSAVRRLAAGAIADRAERQAFFNLMLPVPQVRRQEYRRPVGPVRFIRLQYKGGDWDQDMGPSGDYNALLKLREYTGLRIARATESHNVASLRLYPRGKAPPLVYITGKGNIQMSSREKKVLKKYLLTQGGMLLADNGGGRFHHSFVNLMRSVLPGYEFTAIAQNDILFRQPFVFPNGAPPLWHHSGNEMLGIKHDGRWIVVYHQGDLGDAWKTGHSGARREAAEPAYRLFVNIYHYAVTAGQ